MPLAQESKIALHGRKNKLLLAAKEKLVSYKQLGLLVFAFPACKNVISHVAGTKRGKRAIVSAKESREARIERRLRLEQKSASLLGELPSLFS